MNPHPRRMLTAALLAFFAAAPLARAADSIDLKPLVNERTFFVARFTPSKVKATSVPPWAQQTFKDAGLPDTMVQPMMKGFASAARTFQKYIDIFDKAGVTQAAFVLNFDEKGFQAEPHPMLIAVVAEPDAITKQFQALDSHAGYADLDGVSVWTLAGESSYVSQITPSDRLEMLDKVATLGDSAGVVAMAISEPMRELIRKSTPNLRDPMDLPPALSAMGNLVVASGKVDANDGPHAVVTGEFKDVKQAEQFLNMALAVAPATKALQTSPMTVNGNAITIEARQPTFQAIASDLKPALEQARVASIRVQSLSNMRQLVLACIMYAQDNKGVVPTAITDLGKYTGDRSGKTPAFLLVNPQKPDLKTEGYTYVPAPEGKIQKIKKPQERLAIYEAGDFGRGLNVAFWDGHAEYINNKAHFDALLAAAQAPTAPAAPATSAPAN